MPDNTFENKLSGQLGDFNFTPSVAVWQKLETELTKRKKRRTGIIWFFAGLLLVSAGLIIISRSNEEEKLSETITNNANRILKSDLKPVPEKNEGLKQNDSDTMDMAGKFQLPAADLISNVKAYTSKQNLSAAGSVILSPSVRTTARASTGKAKSKEPASGQEYAAAPLVEKAEQDPSDVIIPDLAMVDDVHNQKQLQIPVKINGIINIASTVAGGKPVYADSVLLADAAKKTTAQKRPVTFGLRIEAGRSASSEQLLSTQKSADLFNSPNTGSSPVVFYPYAQNPLFGWSLAGWIKKPLSQKITLQSGLIYHQYRTGTPVGGLVQGAFVPGSGTNSMSNDQYFRQGDSMTYTNRYHLLSVPAEFSFLLNKGKNLPVSWYAGIEPGWLMGSNALIADTSGILYSDNDLFNRFQVGLQTGFSFRLWHKSSRPLELGPVFQYMLTPVFKTGANYTGHLSFMGLRADWTIFNYKPRQR